MLLVLNTTVSPSWEVLGHHLHFYPTGSRALSMCSLRVHWTRRSRMWSCWMCQQPVRPAFLWTEDVLHHFEFNIHSQLSYLKVPVNMFIIIPIFFFKQMALGCQKNSRSHGRTTGMGWRTRIDHSSDSSSTNEINCNKLTTESNSWNIFTDHHHQVKRKEKKVTCSETESETAGLAQSQDRSEGNSAGKVYFLFSRQKSTFRFQTTLCSFITSIMSTLAPERVNFTTLVSNSALPKEL